MLCLEQIKLIFVKKVSAENILKGAKETIALWMGVAVQIDSP